MYVGNSCSLSQANKMERKSLLKISLYFVKQRIEDSSYSAGVKNTLKNFFIAVYKYHLHNV